jgi:hypothetical protein
MSIAHPDRDFPFQRENNTVHGCWQIRSSWLMFLSKSNEPNTLAYWPCFSSDCLHLGQMDMVKVIMELVRKYFKQEINEDFRHHAVISQWEIQQYVK